MHKSPTVFPAEEFELNPVDLYHYMENLKQQEKEEQQRLKALAIRKLFTSQQKKSGVGITVFGNEETGGEFDITGREGTPQDGTVRMEKPVARGGTPGASARRRRGQKAKKLNKDKRREQQEQEQEKDKVKEKPEEEK